MKTLFLRPDIRGGLGERRVFRVLLKYIGNNICLFGKKRTSNTWAEYGRFDDLLILLDTACAFEATAYLKRQFEADLKCLEGNGGVSLLGKWLPSVNASNAVAVKTAKRLARAFGLSDKAYRQALSKLRSRIEILENNLRERDYTFDYSKQPSKALFQIPKGFCAQRRRTLRRVP
jgi:hypothetical protein